MTRYPGTRYAGDPRRFWRDERAVTPAVGKTLEIGIGVLVVALLTSALYGNVVPSYRTAGGQELADRTLASAAMTTEGVVLPVAVTAKGSGTTTLPATIRGATYEIHANGTVLELTHPHPRIGGRLPLALPKRVVEVTGTWRSTDRFRATASGNRTTVTITIGGAR